MTESRQSGGWFALGLMFGAAIGAAIGLLYAPRPGVDTRRDFAEKSTDLRRRAAEAGAQLEGRSAMLAERVKKSSAEAAARGATADDVDTEDAGAEAGSEAAADSDDASA